MVGFFQMSQKLIYEDGATSQQNGYIFNNVTTGVCEIAELIKTRVAMWIKAKFDIKIYLVEDFQGYVDRIRNS